MKKEAPTALLPLFGTNRTNAEHPAQFLKDCDWIGVPFAGGFCEVRHFKARTIVCNDLNRHAINLARVARLRAKDLIEELNNTMFSADDLAEAQKFCLDIEKKRNQPLLFIDGSACDVIALVDNFEWARHYFVASWMARNGTAGTDGEFSAGLSVRWDAGGGDSVVRFRGAAEALADWHNVFQRCTFLCMDALDFVKIAPPKKSGMKDAQGHGLYVDPPWPDDGARYKHKFTVEIQRELARLLALYKKTRVVVRYGDHPLIRELYPEDRWDWNMLDGRTQANNVKREVLLVNR